MASFKKVMRPGPARDGGHKTFDDISAFSISEASGLLGGFDMGAFGGIVGFISQGAIPK